MTLTEQRKAGSFCNFYFSNPYIKNIYIESHTVCTPAERVIKSNN